MADPNTISDASFSATPPVANDISDSGYDVTALSGNEYDDGFLKQYDPAGNLINTYTVSENFPPDGNGIFNVDCDSIWNPVLGTEAGYRWVLMRDDGSSKLAIENESPLSGSSGAFRATGAPLVIEQTAQTMTTEPAQPNSLN